MNPSQEPALAKDGNGPAAPSAGRSAQKRRTRLAIVTATRELIASGRTPSIDEIAAAADVSRRTIYMHFPTLDQLLLDATTALLAQATVDEMLDAGAPSDDPVARTDALAQALARLAPQTLPLGRKIIALTVDAPQTGGAGDTRRGYRRIEWIERAIAPLRDDVTPEQYERLVSALAIVLGWEALVVLEDIRGLDVEQSEATIRWATRALVAAALDHSD